MREIKRSDNFLKNWRILRGAITNNYLLEPWGADGSFIVPYGTPSNFAYIMDANGYEHGFGLSHQQEHSAAVSDPQSSGTSHFIVRHLRNGNMVFADGHVEGKAPFQLSQLGFEWYIDEETFIPQRPP